MLYIDKETYDIVMNKKNDESYFECDDNMAPIISILNKKGYKTAYCCEGHIGFADNYALIKNTDINFLLLLHI